MRVVQISGALVGAQKLIQRAIHTQLIEQGHESYIFFARGVPEEGAICYEKKVEQFITRGIRKYISKTPKAALLQTRRLIRKLKQVKPDLVHLHVLHNGHMDYEKLLQYLANEQIPVVYTMHDMWAYTGGCYHYIQDCCDGFLSGCTHCIKDRADIDNDPKHAGRHFQKKKGLMEKLNRLHIVAVSEWVAYETRRGFMVQYPISVIPNGVPIPTHLPQRNRSNKISLVAVAAAWTQLKGIDILLELANLLGNDFEIHLIGGYNNSMAEKAPDNLFFHGYCTDKEKLYTFYRNADLHISASSEETFGMTFVEAAFMGTRSIGFASTAIKDTLAMVYGIPVEEMTAKALCDSIQECIKNKDYRLTNVQIDAVKERLSGKNMAEKYLTVYQETING